MLTGYAVLLPSVFHSCYKYEGLQAAARPSHCIARLYQGITFFPAGRRCDVMTRIGTTVIKVHKTDESVRPPAYLKPPPLSHYGLLLCIYLLTVSSQAQAQREQEAALLLQRAKRVHDIEGDLPRAIELYQSVVEYYADERHQAAEALYRIGQCFELMGNAEAAAVYRRVTDEYPNVREFANPALERFLSLAGPGIAGLGDPLGRETVMVLRSDIVAPTLSSDGQTVVFSNPDTGDLVWWSLATDEKRYLTSERGLLPGGSGKYALASSIAPESDLIAFNIIDDSDTAEVRVIDSSGDVLGSWTTQLPWTYVQPGPWLPGGRNFIGFVWSDESKSSWLVRFSTDTMEPDSLAEVPNDGPPQYFEYVPEIQRLFYDTAQDPREYWSAALMYRIGDQNPIILGDDSRNDHLLTVDPLGRYALIVGTRTRPQTIWAFEISSFLSGRGATTLTPIMEFPGHFQSLGTLGSGDYYYILEEGLVDYLPESDWIGIPQAWIVSWAEIRAVEELGHDRMDFARILPHALSQAGTYYHMARYSDYQAFVTTVRNGEPSFQSDNEVLISYYSRRRPVIAWAPSGDRYAFIPSPPQITWFQDRLPLMIRWVHSSRLERISLPVAATGDFLLWLQDEDCVLLSGRSEDAEGLFKINIRNGEAELWLSGRANRFSAPAYRAEANGFYFLRSSGNCGTDLLFSDWTLNPPQLVFSSKQRLVGPLTVSTDGHRIAVSACRRDESAYPGKTYLQVISLPDTSIQTIASLPGFAPLALAWSADDTMIKAWISCIELEGENPETATELWNITVAEGAIERMLGWPANISFLTFSPDGNHTAYAIRNQRRRSILIKMEHLFGLVDQVLYP